MDEAVQFGHHDVVTILQEHHDRFTPSVTDDKDKQSAEQSLDSLL